MPRGDCAMFKVFLKTGEITEVKKFVIDDDISVITNFVFMKEKLQMIFPKLRDVNFKITWRDSEGDDVIIESDDDLILAFTEIEGPLKTLYVTVLPFEHNSQEQNPSQFPQGPSRVLCDVCNNEITTYRYKCLQCFDYDLCGNCEHAGHHSHHMMLRTSTPELPLARCGRKIFEHVNKAVKKANHMAYKECKKRSKWDRSNRPNCEEKMASGEDSCKKGAESSGCPYQNYVPQFYPFVDVISSAMSAAANAATSSASAAAAASQPNASSQTNASSQQPRAGDAQDENNPASQFMEAIRNALNGVFVHPTQSQPNAPTTTNQEQSQPAQSSEASNPSNAPTAPQNEIDLTRSTPDEPMDVSSQRDLGWTMLPDAQQATPTPVVFNAPSVMSQPPQNPVTNPSVITPSTHPLQAFSIPTAAQTPPQPHYPVLNLTSSVPQDPKIAMGLSKLLEMGFSDEHALIALLKRYNGNVDEVIKHIFENK